MCRYYGSTVQWCVIMNSYHTASLGSPRTSADDNRMQVSVKENVRTDSTTMDVVSKKKIPLK